MTDEIPTAKLQALLAAARSRPGASSAPSSFAATPMAYDFKRPHRVGKEQTRSLENIHEHFARLFASTLSGILRMLVDVELAFTDQVLYQEFALSLPTPCPAYRFGVEPPGGRALLVLAPQVLSALIDRAFGGQGRGSAGELRPPTQIETRFVDKLVQRLVRDLERAWEPLTPLRIFDLELESHPEFIQVAAPGDAVVLVAFELNLKHASGLLHLCYPLYTLNPLLPRLRGPTSPAPLPKKAGPAVERRAPLGKVKVPIVVQLAQGSLPLGQVAELRSGDIIKLDTPRSEAAVVFIGGRPKFLGKPGLRRRRRAVQIIEAIVEDDEELYC